MPFHLTSAPFRRLLAAVLLGLAAGASFAQVPGFDEESQEPGDRTAIDEKWLQQTLQEAVKNGEDIDEYRHGGTRLHHALRAGLQNTALWLLAHGADPALQVHDLPSEQPDGNDALQLAIIYHRWRVVDALLRRPGLVPRNAADLAFRWSALSSAHADAAALDVAARELSRRLAWPGGWEGDCLNAWARSRVILPMLAKAATAGHPAHAARPKTLKGRDVWVATMCRESGEATFAGAPRDARLTGRLAKLPPAELARIDARSDEPLLPALTTLIETLADVRLWSSLPLRRPWEDPAFARAVVQALLATPMRPDVQDAALRAVPREALRAALDDDVTLHVWFSRLAHLPPADALAALGAIDDATLARHADAAITGLASKPRHFAGHQRHGSGTLAPEAAWVSLLSRLPAPPALRPDLPILALAPDAAWPVLFERGVVPTASQVAQAWHASTPEQWRTRWPMLRRTAGEEVASQALGQVMADWTAPCEQDDCAPQPQDGDKLQIALASGVRQPPPVTLSPGAARRATPNVLRELAATHLVAVPPSAAPLVPPPDVAPTRPFERVPFDCAAAPDPLIVRAVLHHAFVITGVVPAAPSGDSDLPRPDTLQPVVEPGGTGCAWLVSGGSSSVKGSFDEDDFYTGHMHYHSCSSVTLYGELWRVVDGQLVASGVEGGANEGSLTLASGPRRFLLALPIQPGGCDQGRSGALYEWLGDAANRRPVPVPVPDEGPTRHAFDAQCHIEDPAPCFGLPATDDAPALAQGASDAPLDRDAFVERYGGAVRQRWIDAFLAGDFAALRAGELADAMPAWRRQALAALTASTLPLDQRRQRIAWLFRDAAAMTESFGPTAGKRPEVLGLVAWLPREDWRPMLKALGNDDNFLEALHDAAKARGDARLACVFTKARGYNCPEADNR